MKNILLIDDEKLILLALSMGLGICSTDYNVMTAENGAEAVEILKSADVDVIVTDIRMPVMDGFEFLDYARKNYRYVPAYVMTSDYTPEVEERLKPYGVTRCFEKPFDYKELAEELAGELTASRGGLVSCCL